MNLTRYSNPINPYENPVLLLKALLRYPLVTLTKTTPRSPSKGPRQHGSGTDPLQDPFCCPPYVLPQGPTAPRLR